MKKILIIALLLVGGLTTKTEAQVTCDSIASIANSYLRTPADTEKKRVFISDGQVYRAFLEEDQVAEFSMTFYGNSTYRISTSAGGFSSGGGGY